MNILITTESYYPLKNGVQEITQRYAEFLSSTNSVKIVTRLIQEAPLRETYNGVEIIRVNLFTKKSLYMGEKNKYKSILKELTEWADVMINVCTQTAFTDCILKKINNYKCKKILYFHGMAHFTFPKIEKVDLHDILSWFLNVVRWKLFYVFNKKYISKYDALIHLHQMDCTYKMCNSLVANNFVLENSAHIEDAFLSKEETDSSQKPYLMIANYIHDKNQELAIKAYFRSISKRKLILVGSKRTPYLAKLMRIVEKYKKNDATKEVEFIVGESHDETMKRLSNAFGLIHTSKSEKYPVVISESMAFGIPFIAGDTGIIKYLDGGLICTKLSDFVAAINSFEESNDLRQKLSSSCILYSANHQNERNNFELFSRIINTINTNKASNN